LSEDEKTRQETRYRMKGAPVEVYLASNGEFRWAPAPEACCNKDRTREFLDVLKEMPTDKATVWGTRLDFSETIRRCPLLQKDTELLKDFDDFVTAIGVNATKHKTAKQEQGGEKANGQ
jgi:hypothetical protein